MVLLAVHTVARAFDLSNASVPRDDIVSGGPAKDGIPALTDPDVTLPRDATYLRLDDRVLGVEIGGEARAYPIRVLNWHEVVNDRLGDTHIVVTYCPLCGTGMVFRADHHGQRVFFGVSGLLYNSDVLLYDRATDSLWSQLKMEAVAGQRVGDRLTWLPVQHTTWSAWLADHPQTDVLSVDTGYNRDYDDDPYDRYGSSPRLMFPVGHQDARLPPKSWVAGLVINGEAKAYPLEQLAAAGTVTDQVGGQDVHVSYDAAAQAVHMTDTSGAPVPFVQAYWFAWVAFYPDTAMYMAPLTVPD